MFILDFFNFIIGLILIFFTIIIFHPVNRYKKLKSKEEQLFVQKTFVSIIFFILILILTIISVLSIIDDDSDKFFTIQVLLFNSYITMMSLYNLFMAYELYNTYINPTHYFNRLLKQKNYNYIQEFFIYFITIIVSVLDYYFHKKDKYGMKDHIKNKDNKDEDIDFFCNDSSIFIILGKWKPFLIVFINLIGIIYCYRTKSTINKFTFKNQHKLLNYISKRTYSNILYFIYGIFYCLPIISNTDLKEFFNVFGCIFFLIIIILDYSLHLMIIASSKFCEYRLRKTLLGTVCSCFVKLPKYHPTSASVPLVNESSINEATGLTTFQNETSTALEIISNNPKDKELVSTFKSGIFMEDYFVGYFDQILNIITSSMFKVYNSNYFSSQANEKILSSNIKIGGDVSSIGGSMQNLTVSNLGNNNNKTVLSTNSEIGDEIARFDIKKNMEIDDLSKFKEVLESGILINNNNNFLNISIKSFFTRRCVESIYEQKLKGNKIATSLLSHFIINNNAKNKNIDNPNAYFWSLLSNNGKEEYFSSLKNTSIKTFDKNFTLDIFDSNDDEIVFNENRKNDELSNLLDKYFIYVHGKGINGTFIPSLVGVFKIKINNFKTLLIFITKNSLVENAPKSFYTYWQLIRFLNEKPKKIASSKFNSGSLVKDDPIFERSFQIETKRDNPNYNKIFVKNYSEFVDTVKNDIRFLKEISSKNFDLLLMYYEFENTQKHEKQGKIKIMQTNKGAEFIEESLPKGALFDDETESNINMNSFNPKTPVSLDGNLLSMGGDFLDDNNDNEFGGKSSNLKKSGNLIDFEEKVNISGIDGVFDSFNCLCFLTFENIFDIRKRKSVSNNFYNNFQNKVLTNFTEFKK